MSERPERHRWLAGTERLDEPDTASWWDAMRWAPDLPAEVDGLPPGVSGPPAVSFRLDSTTVQQAMQALGDGFRRQGADG